MKRLLMLGTAILTACTFLCTGIASAHVLKIDGHISVLLHVNPDDDPVAGQQTTYFLYFHDDTGKFALSKCTCTVTVQSQGQTIASQSVDAIDASDTENSYTFPDPAVYTMRVDGKPKQADAFQPFNVLFTVRATGGPATAQPFPWLLGVGLAGLVCLLLLGAYASEYGGAKQQNKKKEKS